VHILPLEVFIRDGDDLHLFWLSVIRRRFCALKFRCPP
jgi:hypothetical protein